jgi:hypothetical protein
MRRANFGYDNFVIFRLIDGDFIERRLSSCIVIPAEKPRILIEDKVSNLLFCSSIQAALRLMVDVIIVFIPINRTLSAPVCSLMTFSISLLVALSFSYCW